MSESSSRSFAVLAALSLALAAPASAAPYAPSVRAQFVAACVRGAQPSLGGRRAVATAYCTCSLGRIERRYTLAQFRAATAEQARTGVIDAQSRADARDCAVIAIRAAHLRPSDLATPAPHAIRRS